MHAPRRDFAQLSWSAELEEDWRHLLALAVREDLQRTYDWTTVALVPEDAPGRASVVARRAGVMAGLHAAQIALAEFDRHADWQALASDGQQVSAGQPVATLTGPARSLLTAERTLLNVLGHLSGIATLTRQFVEAVQGTRARIYDTRKTTPGWRRLEKYAVRCGGGSNHRTGLFDAVLIKDNHLAVLAHATGAARLTPAEAVEHARRFLARLTERGPRPADPASALPIIEVEIDRLEQLEPVLRAAPDIVLLDNMTPDQMREAVRARDRLAPQVELEASGGVNLGSVRSIAEAGVDRISAGALTHSAPAFDVALDWDLSG